MTTKGSKLFNDVPLSILDPVPITQGSNAAQAFKNSISLVQHAENFGFHRYWITEHHNMPRIACSATSIIIGHLAGATNHIRIGSGGIMLPNHAPLVIAEQFGTLESMYPGRIDLGLGRASGGDQATTYALRRTLNRNSEEFSQQLEELQAYFNGTASVHAIPGEGLKIPTWLLGSSDFSARLAAEKGLPFSFATHLSPKYTLPALEIYRTNFIPSDVLEEPYAMVSVNIIAAESDEKAKWLATSQLQQFLSSRRGKESAPLKPPIDNIYDISSEDERVLLEKILDSPSTIVGSPETVKIKLETFLGETKANEVIIISQIYNHEELLHSYEIVAKMME